MIPPPIRRLTSVEHLCEPIDCLPLHVGKHRRVDVHRHRDRLVTETLLYDLRRDAGREESGCVRVSKLTLCFWIGLYPKPFFEFLEQPVNYIVAKVDPDYAAALAAAEALPESQIDSGVLAGGGD